jgi:hypothetical protein
LGAYQLLLNLLKPSKYRPLPLPFIIISVIIFAFHFEVLMPLFSKKYTADVADVLMYLIGGGIYLCMFTPLKRKKSIKKSIYGNKKQVIF